MVKKPEQPENLVITKVNALFLKFHSNAYARNDELRSGFSYHYARKIKWSLISISMAGYIIA